MRVLGVDPGDTTGWSIIDVRDEKLQLSHCGAKKFTHRDLFSLMNNCEPDVVVYEKFFLYPSKAQNQAGSIFVACEMIGIIKLYCEMNEVKLITQTASEGKRFWNDHKLEIVGITTESRHSRDSIKHILTYLKYEDNDEVKEKLKAYPIYAKEIR